MKHRLPMTAAAIVAALTLSGSVATAAVPVETRHAGVAHTTEPSMPPKDHKGNADKPHGNPHTQPQGSEVEDESGDSDHERPQNHGWFVSQAAHDKSVSGHGHGQAVSDVARGDAGKPEAADH